MYDVDLDTEDDFNAIHDKRVKPLVEALTTAAGDFRRALRGLNTFEEQKELVASVDR